MSTRFYEVTVVATKTVVVEVDDNGDEASRMEASGFAFNEVFTGCDVEVTDTVHLKTEHQIEQAKRLSDEVFDMQRLNLTSAHNAQVPTTIYADEITSET